MTGPASSFWERCDPRARLLATAVLSAAALAAARPAPLALAAAATLALLAASGAGAARGLAALRSFRVLLLFSFAVHALFSPGPALLAAGPVSVGAAGIAAGAVAAARLALVLVLSAALVATTPPFALARSLAWALAPLERLGAPMRQAELVLALGLRFVPQLHAESRQVRAALEARGITPAHPRLRMRVRAVLVWLTAVLFGMLERSGRLATALEVKGFALPGRPRPRFAPWRRESSALSLAAAAAAAAQLALR